MRVYVCACVCVCVCVLVCVMCVVLVVLLFKMLRHLLPSFAMVGLASPLDAQHHPGLQHQQSRVDIASNLDRQGFLAHRAGLMFRMQASHLDSILLSLCVVLGGVTAKPIRCVCVPVPGKGRMGERVRNQASLCVRRTRRRARLTVCATGSRRRARGTHRAVRSRFRVRRRRIAVTTCRLPHG